MRLLLAVAIIAVLFVLSPPESGRPAASRAARDLAGQVAASVPPRLAGEGLAALLARPDLRDVLRPAPAGGRGTGAAGAPAAGR